MIREVRVHDPGQLDGRAVLTVIVAVVGILAACSASSEKRQKPMDPTLPQVPVMVELIFLAEALPGNTLLMLDGVLQEDVRVVRSIEPGEVMRAELVRGTECPAASICPVLVITTRRGTRR